VHAFGAIHADPAGTRHFESLRGAISNLSRHQKMSSDRCDRCSVSASNE
jgi:hypothetical protein